jgi:dihydropyrimidinase
MASDFHAPRCAVDRGGCGHSKKGKIPVGSDADIVVFDPKEEITISAKTHQMRVDYSMFEEIKVTGVAKTVML